MGNPSFSGKLPLRTLPPSPPPTSGSSKSGSSPETTTFSSIPHRLYNPAYPRYPLTHGSQLCPAHLLFSQCREIPVSNTQKFKHWSLTIRGQLPNPRRIHPKTLRQSRKPFLQPNLNRLRLLQHPVRPSTSYQSILRP